METGIKTKSCAFLGYITVVLDDNHFEVAVASNDFFISKYTMVINNHVKIHPYIQVLIPNHYQIGISHPAQCVPANMIYCVCVAFHQSKLNYIYIGRNAIY